MNVIDQVILLSFVLVLFCIRDAWLLTSRPVLLFKYCVVVMGSATLCGLVAESISRQQAQAWLENPKIWLPAVSIHTVLLVWIFLRSRKGKAVNWVVLVPTPIWIVAIITGSRQLLIQVDGLTGAAAGIAPGMLYLIVMTLLWKSGIMHSQSSQALLFTSAVHVCGLILVPAASSLEQSLQPQLINWRISLLVLGCITGVAFLSGLLHRNRIRKATFSRSH